ncbi:helix-turn-helix domain-containing protein [Rhizobium sp. CG4]|uniref:LexA family transcriptional regulator n=1 Tax=Rhizobium sp. CG4 TaxID=2726075 RepID=UPI002033C4D0|nr:XRE family transcriptional regulator [Rhizobium sp. CG4]MCM2455325.1 helix-turn-helix domain-containing protein [Rhizobium sp. CG4]
MKWWERLAEEIKALGWSKAELSRRSEISYDNINKYLGGDVDQPRGDTLERLALAIGRTEQWLRDGADDGVKVTTLYPLDLVPVPVVGKVEAGAFRQVDELDQSEAHTLSMPRDTRFPNARLMAFDVSGDSMNNLSPRPIFPGDRIICVAFEDVAHEVPLRDGMVVVVERTTLGGHIREWSVKQIELYQDRTEFHPRSTSSKHKPIVVDQNFWQDDGSEVSVIAVVRRIVNDLPI